MHIRRATLVDAADIATMASNAMLDDEFVAWLCPKRRIKSSAYRAAFLHRTKKRLWAGSTLLIMVSDQDDAEWDGSERVISYMAVTHRGGNRPPRPFWDVVNAHLNWFEINLSYYLHLDHSMDYGKLDRFIKQIENGPLMAYKECWDLEHLSVGNHFQRRGVGQKMVKAAQSLATSDGVPLILLASWKGIGLYKKCGFKHVDDIESGELRSPVRSPVMLWNP